VIDSTRAVGLVSSGFRHREVLGVSLCCGEWRDRPSTQQSHAKTPAEPCWLLLRNLEALPAYPASPWEGAPPVTTVLVVLLIALPALAVAAVPRFPTPPVLSG